LPPNEALDQLTSHGTGLIKTAVQHNGHGNFIDHYSGPLLVPIA